jgi:(p)ppGpp synthase/HD superfamily hydrolase
MEVSSRFKDALTFAFDVHREQNKKGGSIPYISHLLEVAALVLSYGGSEDEAIGALLHDAVEDHPDVASFKLIGERYGERVGEIVQSCSDASSIPKPPWTERKEKYIAHIAHADESALMVAAADKLANARAVIKDHHLVGESVWKRFNAPKPEQLWYYRTVTEALGERAKEGRVRELVEELKRAVAVLETLGDGDGANRG